MTGEAHLRLKGRESYLGVLILVGTSEMTSTHPQATRVCLVNCPDDVNKLVPPSVSRQNGNGSVVLLGLEV